MMVKQMYAFLVAAALFMTLGSAQAQTVDTDFQDWLLEELIMAEEGATIVMPAGKYYLDVELSISENNVTLKGMGKNKTILSFKLRTSGSEGLMVTGSGVILEDFALEDSKGDGIKVMRADGITFRRLRVAWTAGPNKENGAYGLYPVQSRNVLIEDCEVFAASDAGIYVGQSQDIVVRRNFVKDNVAGIEIENSQHADVYDNLAIDNSGGILVFNLPALEVYGEGTRVYQNSVLHNNQPNFAATGNMVAGVPQGTGIMVMANRSIEIYDNIIDNHQTASVFLVSFLVLGGDFDDPKYNPYTEKVFMYNNLISNSGYDPVGGSSELSKESIKALRGLIGMPWPDVVYDGGMKPDAKADDAVCITAEKGLTFVNVDLLPDDTSRDLGPQQCRHERLKRVVL